MSNRNRATCWARRAQGEDGGALIEMALTLPVLFTLIFCFIEMCLAFYAKDMISECARAGTRYAIYRGSSCPNSTTPTCQATQTQISDYVTGLGWPNLAGGTMTVSTSFPSGNQNPGSMVKVSVSYTLPIRVPFTPTSPLTFTSTSQMRILQ